MISDADHGCNGGLEAFRLGWARLGEPPQFIAPAGQTHGPPLAIVVAPSPSSGAQSNRAPSWPHASYICPQSVRKARRVGLADQSGRDLHSVNEKDRQTS
jgi:hypothetical protein